MLWTLVLVLAVVVEAITVDLVSIWFGVGAIGALVCELLNFNWIVQSFVFMFISILCIILSRPLSKKYLRSNTIRTNLDRVIGKHALVTKAITLDNKGEVKVMGNYWSAVSLNNEVIEEDCYVEVLSIEGAHLVVKKIEKGE